jgi:hypothetical protein
LQQYGFWYRPGVRGFEVLLDSEDTCAGAHTYADSDSHANTDTNTNTDSNTNANANADAHADAHTHTDSNTNTDANANAGIRHRLRSTDVSSRRHRQWPDRHRHAKQRRHTPLQSRQQLPGVVRHRGDIGGHCRLVDAGSVGQHQG